MVAPNPLAARRRTNSSSFSVAVPSSLEESVVSGAIANRFAVSCPLLNLKGDQTTIDRTLDSSQDGLPFAKPIASPRISESEDRFRCAQPILLATQPIL